MAVGPAWGLSFELGDVYGQVDSFFTLGAAVRMEARDPSLIGKSNLQPGLCTHSNYTDDPFTGTNPDAPTYSGGIIGSTCNSTTDPSLNLAYVNAPGSYNINGDDGNLSFDQGDIVSAAAKLNSSLNVNWGDLSLSANAIWFFNETLVGFDQLHPDTTLQPATTAWRKSYEDEFGTSLELLDAYLSYFFQLGDRLVTIKVGRQGLNWGESTALALNSINTVNPPDQRRLHTPGFDLGELFQPVGMAVVSTDLTLNLALEAFYQYEWRPVLVDAPGTFYSSSDILGGTDASGGQHAMLSFGKAPEDPYGIYSSEDNPDDPFALGSAGGRTIYRLPDQRPRDDGQYGFALKYFAENFNNGTEFAFYFANYHNRIPSASFYAADRTCAGDAANVQELADNCGAGLGDIGTLMLSEEPLPVDTARLFAEYVEDIQMYGVSFNTTVGDYALSGEYSFRPNQPIQVHTVDLVYAALQPAFPDRNIRLGVPGNIGGVPIDQIPGFDDLANTSPVAIPFPGRRVAVPDYVQTIYRNDPYDSSQARDNYYIPGYVQLPMGQLTTTVLKTIGGDNWLKASQIIVIAEGGITHVLDMPSLDEVQFQGAATNSHASSGADGTQNSEIADSAAQTDGTNTGGDADGLCSRRPASDFAGANNGAGPTYELPDGEYEPCRQNPTTQDPDGFGDQFSYGVRFISLIRYQDFFAGINFEPLIGVFYDIGGVAPGLGQNFQEGRITGLFGLRFDYLSRWAGELRYTLNEGDTNAQRDRDTLALTVRYEF